MSDGDVIFPVGDELYSGFTLWMFIVVVLF